MKRIRNPFDPERNHCFGCSPNNPHGLKMEFIEEKDIVLSYWKPDPQYQGFKDFLHGGIQSTLMDEIASWTVFVKCKTAGFTTSMNIKFKKPVSIKDGEIKIVSKLLGINKRIAEIQTEIYNSREELCSMGTVNYFIYAEEQAREKLNYPGYEQFFYAGPQ